MEFEFWMFRGRLHVTGHIDFCDWMIGIAWGTHDTVIKLLPCFVLCIDRWPGDGKPWWGMEN